MNKKFIEFMKRTIWRWSKSEQCFITYIYDPKIQLKLAKPEDLLGWWLQFMEENKHDPISDMVGIIMDWARFGKPKDMTARIIRKLRKERQEFKDNLKVCENELELLKRHTVSHFTPFCEIDTRAGHSFVTRCVYCGILDE